MGKLVKYIDNDEILGIAYDWPKIFKRCRRLKLFPDDKTIWNPLDVPVQRAKWNLILSIRAKGKTTNLLLLGLVMYQMYGTMTAYVGQNQDQIRPKNTEGMYNVIRENHYIAKIFDNRWNDIRLKSGGKWYLVNVDEEGKIIEMNSEPTCIMVNIAAHEDYKSTMNYPRADLIIYDEFIRKTYYPNEFIDFCDLLSTINRNRLSSVVFMCANTINKHYQYFNELDVYDQLQPLQAGQEILIEGTHGATVYIKIIDPAVDSRRQRVNRALFGFKNPSLGAITGDTTWTEFNYPHCLKTEKDQVIFHNCYIQHNKKLVNLELVHNSVGLCINAHFASRLYDDSIVYTCEPIYDKRFRYKLGSPSSSRIDKIINDLIKTNKIYFATNDVGSFFHSYLDYCKILR